MKVARTITTWLLGTAIVSFGASSAQAAILFQDDFDSETQGLGLTALANWTITAGNLDIIGTDFFDFHPGNGNYLDMDGTPATNARIETKQLFNLATGTYQLSFNIGNNTGVNSADSELLVQLGSVFTESFAATSTLTSITRSFTVTTSTVARLSFEEIGTPDFGGSILDAVELEQTQATAIPTPALLPGLIGLGAAALRKRKPEQVDAEV